MAKKFKPKTLWYCWDCGSDLILIKNKWYCPYCEKDKIETLKSLEETKDE